MTRLLLALMTAFVCVVTSPILTTAPPVNAVPRLTNPLAQTQSLVQEGKTLYEAGQFAAAVKVLQQAAFAFEAQGDGLKRAMMLSNLSLAYQQLAQWPQATQAISQSLKLLQTGRNLNDFKDRLQVRAQILNTQGRLQKVTGQPELALSTWQQATATYTQAGDQAGIALSLINQSQAQQSLGLYRRAVATLTQVNQTLQKQPDSRLKVAGLCSLGSALRMVGELDQSRQILQQSLEIAQRLQSPSDISAALLSLGNTARSQQDTQVALQFLKQASLESTSLITRTQAQLNQLSLLIETKAWSQAQALWPQLQVQINNLPPSHGAIYARIDLAESLARLKQSALTGTPKWSEIAHFLAKAVQQAKSLGDQRAEAYALGTLGGLYEQTKQWADAKNLTQQALLKAQIINATDIA